MFRVTIICPQLEEGEERLVSLNEDTVSHLEYEIVNEPSLCLEQEATTQAESILLINSFKKLQMIKKKSSQLSELQMPLKVVKSISQDQAGCLNEDTVLHLEHEIVDEASLCLEQGAAKAELILSNNAQAIVQLKSLKKLKEMKEFNQLNEPLTTVESVNLLNKEKVIMEKLNELQMPLRAVKSISRDQMRRLYGKRNRVNRISRIKRIKNVPIKNIEIPAKKESVIEKYISVYKNIKGFVEMYRFIRNIYEFIAMEFILHHPTISELIEQLKRLIGH